MDFIAIIPARYSSQRFPGKALVDINGKTMIQRVYEQVSKVLDNVWVATDDDRIMKNVSQFGGNAIMTSFFHQSGTDRVDEAAQIIQKNKKLKFDVIINVQGDEPFIQKEQLKLLMNCFSDSTVKIATLIKRFNKDEDIFDPNIVKVVTNSKDQAVYFSRSPIPYIRNSIKEDWHKKYEFKKHIGIYAYHKKTLKTLTNLPASSLEKAESLEQNRWIENGYSIMTAETKTESFGIDTPEDLQNVLKKGLG